MLEICVDSLESAYNAIHGGADELEICSSLAEGGLTPSIGLVTKILDMVDNISSNKKIHSDCNVQCSCLNLRKKPKVNIMLRCRTGSDFCYSNKEMETMLADLQVFKSMNIDRFVFGALTMNGDMDFEKNNLILKNAGNIPVTLHRAYDVCKEPLNQLEDIISLGFSRILTSGQKSSAVNPEALSHIKKLIEKSDHRIEIMPGSGLSSSNVGLLKDIGCKIFHASCKTIRKLPTNLSMGSNESEYICISDQSEVIKMKQAIS